MPAQARRALSLVVIGSAEEFERVIILREVLAQVSRDARLIGAWKKAGYSSQEIAQFQGRTVSAVDTLPEQVNGYGGSRRVGDANVAGRWSRGRTPIDSAQLHAIVDHACVLLPFGSLRT